MSEFYSMSDQERNVLIENALEAGPTIPFPNFLKLFKTWLEVLADETEENRKILVSSYVNEVTNFPQKLIAFNLDGMLEIYLTLDDSKKMIINNSLKLIIEKLESDLVNSESTLSDSEILDGFSEIKSGEAGRMSERKPKESNP